MHRILFSVFFLIYSVSVLATPDTEFWFTIPVQSEPTTNVTVKINNLDIENTVSLSIPARSDPDQSNYFQPLQISLAPFENGQFDLSPFLEDIQLSLQYPDMIYNEGILISSPHLINATLEIEGNNHADAISLKGENGLGNNFYVPFQNVFDNQVGNPAPHASFIIVATEDNTNVTITPTTPLYGGITANVPFDIALQKGQAVSLAPENYQTTGQLAANRPAGTRVESDQSIAVFMFDERLDIGNTCAASVGLQVIPVDKAGDEYLLSDPSPTEQDYFFITATQSATDLYLNGVFIATIDAGEQYSSAISSADIYHIGASQPVIVNQLQNNGCGAGMLILPPLDRCNGNFKQNVFHDGVSSYQLQIIARSGSQDNFRVNNGAPNTVITDADFELSPQNNQWVFATVPLDNISAPTPGGVRISNSQDVFHLAVIKTSVEGVDEKVSSSFVSDFDIYTFSAGINSPDGGQSHSVCTGNQIQLAASGGVDFLWTPSTYLDDPQSQFPVATPFSSVSYTVVITGACNQNQVGQVDLNAIASPEASFSLIESSGCSPFEIEIANNSLNFESLSWDFGDGNTSDSSTETISHTYENNGTEILYLPLSLTAVNQQCVDSISSEIAVLPAINTEISLDPSLLEGCAPHEVNFSQVSQNAGSFFWDFGNGQNSSEANPVMVFENFTDVTQTYMVVLEASSLYSGIGSCSATDTVYIEVHPYIDASFQTTNTSGCTPLSFQVSNNSQGSGNFIWSFNDGQGDFLNNDVSFDYILENDTGLPVDFTLELFAENMQGCTDTAETTVEVFPVPASSFLPNGATVCSGDSLDFSGSPDNMVEWQWSFGDFAVSDMQNPTDIQFLNNDPANTAVEQVSLIVTNGYGCSDESTGTVEVYPFLEAGFSPVSTNLCPQSGFAALQINNQSTGASSIEYLVQSEQQQFVVNNPEDVFSIDLENTTNTPIEYDIKQIVSNDDGCIDSLTVTVTVFPEVIASAENVMQGCHPLPVDFVNTSQNADTYMWDFANGQVSSLENPSVVFKNTGNMIPVTYEVSLLATSSFGCSSETIVDVQVNPLPSASFSLEDSQICPPFEITLTDESEVSGGLPYEWNMGDGTEITTAPGNAFHTYSNLTNQPITYNISLLVENEFGCTGQMDQNIEVLPDLNAEFTVFPEQGCHPLETTITNNSSGASGILPYQWDFGNSTSTTQQIQFNRTFENNSVTTEEVFEVKLVATSVYGCTDTISKQVTVLPRPVAYFETSVSQACTPAEVSFMDASQGESLEYAWTFEPGQTGSGPGDQVYTYYLGPGQQPYPVQPELTVTNQQGCSDTFNDQVIIYPAVIAQFSMSEQQGCAPLAVGFENSSIGGQDYLWSFGSGNQSQEINPSYQFQNDLFDQTQFFQIKLVVTSEFGCKDSVLDQVEVFPAPIADFQLSQQEGCSPLNVQVTDNSLGTGNETYLWYLDEGVEQTGYDLPFNFTYVNQSSEPVSERIDLILTNEFGCTSGERKNISVYPEVTADFSMQNNVDQGCNPLNIQFLNESVNASSYFWDFGDQLTSTAPEPGHTFFNTDMPVQEFEVFMQALSVFGCTGVDTETVTVFAKPVADFTVVPLQQVLPEREITLTNTTTQQDQWNYLWNISDGTTIETQDKDPIVHQLNIDTEDNITRQFSVTLQAFSSQCSDDITQTVTVLAREAVVGLSPAAKGCPPLEVQFSNESTFGDSFYWDFDDGNFSEEENPLHTFTEPGVYDVSLSVTSNGETSFASATVEVFQAPTANFLTEPEEVFLPGGEVQMLNLSGMAFDNFWDFGDGNTSEEYQPVHEYTQPGNYTITLTVGNDTEPQCFDEFSSSVSVVTLPELSCKLLFPNAFTPDPTGPSGGIYFENDPANYVFHPLHNLIDDFEMQIFNRWGEKIFESNNIMKGWDGYYQGRMVPLGVYVFVAEGTCLDGDKIRVKGDVTVLR